MQTVDFCIYEFDFLYKEISIQFLRILIKR